MEENKLKTILTPKEKETILNLKAQLKISKSPAEIDKLYIEIKQMIHKGHRRYLENKLEKEKNDK